MKQNFVDEQNFNLNKKYVLSLFHLKVGSVKNILFRVDPDLQLYVFKRSNT